jgi:hypothetical protein
LVLDFLREEPAPAVKKGVEARFASFEKHKKTLLDHLSENRRPKSRPFDDEKCWLRLTRLAQIFFLWQAMPPAAKREAAFRKLAKDLERISKIAEKVKITLGVISSLI